MSIRRSTSNTASLTWSNSKPARRSARCANKTGRDCGCCAPWCASAITKLDSFFNAGQGISDILPLDNDELAIRHQVWLATDQAYKRAGEAFSNKKAMLKQLNVEQPVDDFAKAEPVVSIGPVAKLDVDPAKWTKMLESATAVYKNDPQIQSLTASLNFIVLSQYFVNTEGTVTRHGSTHYRSCSSASEQAPDGMRLDRSPQYTSNRIEEMPTPEEFQTDALKLVDGHEETCARLPSWTKNIAARSFSRTMPPRTCFSI